MDKTELAKIISVEFGWGGYQDAQIGLSLTFEGDGTGCQTFIGCWCAPPSEHAKWNENDQTKELGKTARLIRDTLTDAKVQSVSQLLGKPVELTYEGNLLQSWRILTEVI